MALPNLSPIFISLSALGFFLLWVVIALNGALEALFETKSSGVFPNGRLLKTTFSGIGLIDDAILPLVIFFDGMVNLVDMVPYLLLFDFVYALNVMNMMATVENRRADRSSWLRFPTLWVYLWNCGGVAIILPIYALFYFKQGAKSISSLPTSEAHALPFTALCSLLVPLPLILPSLIGASPFKIQDWVVIYVLICPISVVFQALASTVVSRISYKGSAKPVRIAYLILGAVSALVHLGIVLYAVFSPAENMSFGRIFFPHNNAVRRGQPDIMTEGALLFIQYDYIIIILTVLVLGTYIFRTEPVFLLKSPNEKVRANGSVLALVGITAVFGPGAGLAFALYCKERRLDSMAARSKLLPIVESNIDDTEEEDSEDEVRSQLFKCGRPENDHRRWRYGSFAPLD